MRVVISGTTPCTRALGAVQRRVVVVRHRRGVTPIRRGAGIVAVPPGRPIVLRRRRRRPPIVGSVVPLLPGRRGDPATWVVAAQRGGGRHRVRCRPLPRPIRRQLRQSGRQLDPQLVPERPPQKVVNEALGQSRLPRLVDVNRRDFQNPGSSAESGIYPDISRYIRWNLLAIQCESKTEDTAGTLTSCSGFSWKD